MNQDIYCTFRLLKQTAKGNKRYIFHAENPLLCTVHISLMVEGLLKTLKKKFQSRMALMPDKFLKRMLKDKG